MRMRIARGATQPRSLARTLGVLGVIVLLVCGSGATFTLAQGEIETLEPGKLTVAFNGDMPMTSAKDGELIGTDGEMIALIAEDLGLEIVPQQMDWASAIESTTSGRVDLMLGAMGWTAERSEVMLLTDPIYYFGIFLIQKEENNWNTFADMNGKVLGTVNGFTIVPEMKRVPGVKEVKLYDTSDGVIRDLVAGRIDIAVLDPPFTAAAIKAHPEWGIHQVPIIPDPTYPLLSETYNIIIGINKNEPELYEAVNAGIADLWATCANQVIMAEYGVTDPAFFVPPDPNPRIGVDRPEGWESPTLNPECDASAAGASATPTT